MLSVKRKKVSEDIASCIMSDVVMPFYQPIIGIDKTVIGYEALARRWDAKRHAYTGIDFLLLDKNASLHIDIWMLRSIIKDLPRLADQGVGILSINLNPMPYSVTYQNLLQMLLLQAKVLCIKIWFEVLEHTLLDDKQHELIEMLRARGASIVLDDFGTQECNFLRMMVLPYDVIKLDRSLLLQACRSSHSMRMLSSLVEYLQRLGMQVVCEGVETLTHIDVATLLGCDYQQGYAHAMPAPISHWDR